MNAFNIPIQIFRNAEFVLPFSLANADGTPMDVGGYTFEFMLAPIQGDNSFGPVALTYPLLPVSPAAGGTFIMSPEDTATLSYLTTYNWRILAQPPASDPSAILGGIATVTDSPAMPS